MSPDAIGRLTVDQIIAIIGGDDETPRPSQVPGLSKAQRDVFDAVCARFGLTPLHLLAQPLDVTRSQILDVRPALRSQANPFHRLTDALKEYGRG